VCDSYNPSQRQAFQQQFVDQLLGISTNPALAGVGDKLPPAVLALSFRLAVMNSPILYQACSLTFWALHQSIPSFVPSLPDAVFYHHYICMTTYLRSYPESRIGIWYSEWLE